MDEGRASQEEQQVDGTTWASGRQGPFHLGKHFEEVEPDLGLLYEARHAVTGAAALLLRAGEGMDWRSEGPWRVRLSCEPQESTVTLEVDQAPARVPVKELANILVLMTAAVERVENNPEVQTHLAGASVRSSRKWSRRAEGVLRSKKQGALAGLAVLLSGLGLWLYFSSAPGSQEPDRLSAALLQTGAWHLANSTQPEGATIAYPLPAKPFSNQAAAPCYPELGEEQINGGCWVALEKRPPCLPKTQAEHQGKCYLPISKDRDRGDRPPQSAKP